VTVTLDTAADAEEARLEPDCALMTDANAWPFCRRLILFAAGVLGLKKASQFVLISVTAADELPPAEADGAADVAETVAGGFVPGLGELLQKPGTYPGESHRALLWRL
jgi:hypothetical protein